MAMSPSVWRVWIEMSLASAFACAIACHPPCGGCGLKCVFILSSCCRTGSPSVWRVWIEIDRMNVFSVSFAVTLRVEGVD